MPSLRRSCYLLPREHRRNIKTREVRARAYLWQLPSPEYVSVLEHRCGTLVDCGLPILESLFGPGTFVHDMDVTVHIDSQTTKTYQWRGSLAVFRKALYGPGLVNVRAGETEIIDCIVKYITEKYALPTRKRYPRHLHLEVANFN